MRIKDIIMSAYLISTIAATSKNDQVRDPVGVPGQVETKRYDDKENGRTKAYSAVEEWLPNLAIIGINSDSSQYRKATIWGAFVYGLSQSAMHTFLACKACELNLQVPSSTKCEQNLQDLTVSITVVVVTLGLGSGFFDKRADSLHPSNLMSLGRIVATLPFILAVLITAMLTIYIKGRWGIGEFLLGR